MCSCGLVLQRTACGAACDLSNFVVAAFSGMVRLVYGIFRDLYIVLLVIYLIELFSGSDFLHDVTRKGVVTATIGFVIVKVVQHFCGISEESARRMPRRQKKTEGGKSSSMDWAASEMQGWRPAMEDATCIVPSLKAPLANQALFAVFDGHGGAQVSNIASKKFAEVVEASAVHIHQQTQAGISTSSSSEGLESNNAHSTASPAGSGKDGRCAAEDSGNLVHAHSAEQTLRLAMLTMDSLLRKGGKGFSSKPPPPGRPGSGPLEIAREMEAPEKRSPFNLVGSTAIIAMLDFGADSPHVGRPHRLTVANCGDSRAVLCRAGVAIALSEDHKPELQREESRIRKAGGHVALIGPCHRIDGWGLNLSRALGDFHYKARSDLPPEEQKVIAVPELKTLDLTEDDEFLVLGCDGVFELNTSQMVVDIVRKRLAEGSSVEKATEYLLDKSCSDNLAKTRGKGGDNCSAIVVRLTR